jgi:hypothetical protein
VIGLGAVTGGAVEGSTAAVANTGKVVAAGMTAVTAGAHKRAQEKKKARGFLSGERLAKNPILDLSKRGKVENESGLAEMGHLALKTAGVGLMQNGGTEAAQNFLHDHQDSANTLATGHINSALEEVSPHSTESDTAEHAEENATTETNETANAGEPATVHTDEPAHTEPATSETAATVHTEEPAHTEPATSETAATVHTDEPAHTEPATSETAATPEHAEDSATAATPEHAEDSATAATPEHAEDSATAATPEHAEDSATAATPEHAEDSATAATPEHEEAAADLEHEDQKSAPEETSAKPTDHIPEPEEAAADPEHEEPNNAPEKTDAEPTRLEDALGEHRDTVEEGALSAEDAAIGKATEFDHELHERPEAAKVEEPLPEVAAAPHAAFTPTPTPKKAPAPAPAPAPASAPGLERAAGYRERAPKKKDGWWTRLKRWAGRKATQAGNAIGRAGTRVRGFFGGAR